MKKYTFDTKCIMFNIIITLNIIVLSTVAIRGASCQDASWDDQDNPVVNDLLWQAATEGNIIMLNHALKNGACINAILFTGYTALMEAICNRHIHLAVKLAQRADIDVNVANKNGITALQLAAAGGFATIVSTLLEKRANTQATDKYGKAALARAIDSRHENIVELLTKAVCVCGDNS